MMYFLFALGLVAHAFFWGAGPALLLLPGRWRPLFWSLAPGLGFGLQSAVVWFVALAGGPGTEAYAGWSELLPLALLLSALKRVGREGIRTLGRALLRPAALLVVALMLVSGSVFLTPMAVAGKGVTASSMGSCDHADYAAGARVLAEFSRDSREGMLGLRPAIEISSVGSFFDFWLRLNHFTPAALIAHASSLLGVEAYRLVSIFGAVAMVLNIPLVFLVARMVARLPWGWSGAAAALYALSPLGAYAVHQGALGQILAAQGIATIVIGAALAWGRREWRLVPIIAGALWLLAGSYNFILVVCLAQAGTWLVGRRLLQPSRFARFLGALQVLALAFLLMGAVFWPRLSGIAERLVLLDRHDYGWSIPLGSWESWLGLVGDIRLGPVFGGDAPWLGPLCGLLWTFGLVGLWRRARQRALGPASLVLPVACGWMILAWQSLHRANASYDAFKLISVFLPGLLAGLVGVLPRRSRVERYASGIFLGLVLAVCCARAWDFARFMSAPPLRVDKHLVGLQRLEALPEVSSLNVRIDDYWCRLWANAFLLRKQHFFSAPAYEGRVVSPLSAEWDLTHSILRTMPVAASDAVDLGMNFFVVRRSAVSTVALSFGPDWYAIERNRTDQWRWSKGRGTIRIDNLTSRDRPAQLNLNLQGAAAGENAMVVLNGATVAQARLTDRREAIPVVAVSLRPGPNILELKPAGAAARKVAGDTRPLGVAVHQVELKLLEPD